MADSSSLKVFLEPLKKAVDQATPDKPAILTRKEISCIFGNVEQIYQANKAFYHDLKETITNHKGYPSPPPIGTVFLNHVIISYLTSLLPSPPLPLYHIVKLEQHAFSDESLQGL